ncbi:hypothetical protein RB596_002382, partial [Gaeumannomyces avenae]
EPIAALGLACNILQVVEVGLNTIRVAKQVYKDGSLDPALTGNASALESISGRIHGTKTSRTTIPVTTASSSTAPSSTQASASSARLLDKQLSGLAEKCQGAARELREKVNFLNRHPTRAKLIETLKITAKTAWRKRRLERLEGKLNDAQGVSQTSLLARVYERLEQSSCELSSLEASLVSFIDEYHTGKTDVLQLVSAEAAHTKAHITTATMESGKAVSNRITERLGQLETRLKSDVGLVVRGAAQRDGQAGLVAKRERLLRSLKFKHMNERRNKVTPSHSGTFSWVLRDGSDSDHSSDTAGTLDQDANTRDMPHADIA